MTFAMTVHAVQGVLDRWVAAGWLRSLDRALVRFLQQEAAAAAVEVPPLLLLAAALVSHQNGRGHVCLDLQQTLSDPDASLSLPPDGDGSAMPPPRPSTILADVDVVQWQAALRLPLLVGTGAGNTPLVLENARLYLRRYWQYEQQIVQALQQRLQHPPAVAEQVLRNSIASLFVAPAGAVDWQKIACALAARAGFAIITGGPGTGKTTTVVKLLAVLQAMALQESGTALRIRLAAPTGKAAARLNASIAGQISVLREQLGQPVAVCDAIMAEQVCTLHKLLGTLPDSRHFRHHAGNPLPVDVVVVDEASMVDVEMMAKLLDALPSQARLILLGDKDQLASVEAGAVLGQLCARADSGHYLPDTAAWLQTVTGEILAAPFVSIDGALLDQSVTMLRHSHRFDAQSGIGQLARAVNVGDVAAVSACLSSPASDIAQLSLREVGDSRLDKLLVDGYRGYLQQLQQGPQSAAADTLDRWAHTVLRTHGSFQLLCALRSGDWGVEGINRRAVQALQAAGLLQADGDWYAGRPIMVTRNDYSLKLMNGDIGIALPHPAGLRVVFPAGDGSNGVRWILPGRLAEVETVFAMTVHKSQGSEFEHAVLLLPERASPVLTRELLYTGITRASRQFTLVDSSEAVLHAALGKRVQRASGSLVPAGRQQQSDNPGEQRP